MELRGCKINGSALWFTFLATDPCSETKATWTLFCRPQGDVEMTWAAQLNGDQCPWPDDVKISKLFLTVSRCRKHGTKLQLFFCLGPMSNTLFVHTLLFPNFKFVGLSENFLIWKILWTTKYLWQNCWAFGKTQRISLGIFLVLNEVNGIFHFLIFQKFEDITTTSSEFVLWFVFKKTINEIHFAQCIGVCLRYLLLWHEMIHIRDWKILSCGHPSHFVFVFTFAHGRKDNLLVVLAFCLFIKRQDDYIIKPWHITLLALLRLRIPGKKKLKICV